MADTPEDNGKKKRARRKNNKGFLLTGIGASAGGLKALESFFDHMPPDSGIAFVVILHLSPEHESSLATLLQRRTKMQVLQVTERIKVAPNHVYVIPPAKQLIMADGHIEPTEVEKPRGRRATIDLFFRTLAEAYRHQSIGIVLSGTGMDGTLGLRNIKEGGGVSMAQDPMEAEHDGMPRSAIDTGLVDFVLPVGDMPAKLLTIKQTSEKIQIPPEGDKEPRGAEADALREVLSLLRARTGHDFNTYKRSTILRRIARRLQVNNVEDIGEYLLFMRNHPPEVQGLLSELLINVTNFFRDPHTFEVLEKQVVPKLFENKTDDAQVRVWTTGCSTGEEAYSIAMLLVEHASRLDRAPRLQIFATDIDDESIKDAREGAYPETISVDVSADRLKRFFTKDGTHYRVKKEIREMVLFAPHNLLRDPPFSKLDLVTCRNLLIYLNRETQDRVLELFHFALSPDSYLFLGISESADNLPELFFPLDKKHRIFKRRSVSSIRPPIPSMPLAGRWEVKLPELPPVARKTFTYAELHHELLEHYAPPSVLVNEDYDIVHSSENAARYLRFTGGEPSRNLLRVVHHEIRLDLRGVLFAASQAGGEAESRRLTVKVDGETRHLNLMVRPVKLTSVERGFWMVIFGEEPEPEVAEGAGREEGGLRNELEPVVRQMESEIHSTKEQLRGTIEQYETSTEELKASNEELQAMNEELRSATEELETSKEELQSLNEELQTVNHELKDKVDEVMRINSDLQNLLVATDIGTIFLDRDLCIKRYTPRVQEFFNLIPSDLGRPLAHVTHKLNYSGLPDDAERVIETLIPREREIQALGGGWYIARLLPYRTVDDKIDGVVLTFVDITERKATESRLQLSEARLSMALRAAESGAWDWDLVENTQYWSPEMYELWGIEPSERSSLGSMLASIHEEDRERVNRNLKDTFARRDTEWHDEFRIKHPEQGVRFMLTINKVSYDDEGRPLRLLGNIVDITGRKLVETQLRYTKERQRLLVDSVEDYAIFTMNPTGHIEEWNKGAENIFGYRPNEILGKHLSILFTPEDREANEHEKEMQMASDKGRAEDEGWHIRKDGSRFYASGVMTMLRDGGVLGYVKVLRDLTEHQVLEEELQRSRDNLEVRVRERTSDLEHSNSQIRYLVSRVVSTQELERRRISRELHDHLGQQLTGLRLALESLKGGVGGEKLRKEVTRLQDMVSQLDTNVDFLAWELRPAALEETGLVAALENFVQEWSRHFAVAAEFHMTGLNKRLATEVEINIYRIAQEALNNVVKHAKASRVDVMLERRDGHAVLIVGDDGKGFDAEEQLDGEGRGMGLVSMKERAAIIGGTLEVESAPGGGTTIYVRVPV